MSDSTFMLPGVGGGSVGTHEAKYVHDEVRLFDASVLLDMSSIPPADGGVVQNIGLMQGCNWLAVGSWSRITQGNGYVWKNELGVAGITFAPLHSEATSGASFYAAGTSITIGQANPVFGITDTSHDLKALYEWTSSKYRLRPYKIDISSGSPTNAWATFYIGEITKDGDNYTITGYRNQHGTTKTCNGYGTWSTTNVRWRIYEAVFETESFTSDATYGSHSIAMSMWYAPGSNPTSTQIFGRSKDSAGGAFYQGFGVGHGSTAGGRVFQCNHNGSGFTYADLIPNTPVLRHYALVLSTVGYAYTAVPFWNGKALNNSNLPGVATPYYGMMGIGMDIQNHTPVMPQNSIIAFPRIWRGACSEATIAACYEYERNVLGIARDA